MPLSEWEIDGVLIKIKLYHETSVKLYHETSKDKCDNNVIIVFVLRLMYGTVNSWHYIF